MKIPGTLLNMLNPKLVEILGKTQGAKFSNYYSSDGSEEAIIFHKKFEPEELEAFSDKFKVHLTKNYILVFKSSTFDVIITYDYFGDSDLDNSIAEYKKGYIDIETIEEVNEILEKELAPCEENYERTY